MPGESIKERIDQNKNNSIDTNEINDFIFDPNEGDKNLNDLGEYLNNYHINNEIINAINDFFKSKEGEKIKGTILNKLISNKPLDKNELSLIYLDMIYHHPKDQPKFEANKPINQICDGKLIKYIQNKYLIFTYTGEKTEENNEEIYKGLDNKYTFGHNLTESQKNIISNILSGRKSPITAEMIADSCKNSKNVPVEYLLGFMQNDSRVGTMGLGAKTHNPGNVGNTGKEKKDRGTREKGVNACAENLQKRIDAYLNEKEKHNGKGFNDFPTPEELATGKTKSGLKYFGIYMTATKGPKRVAKMVKTRTNRLRGE